MEAKYFTRIAKPMVILVLLLPLLSSCYSYKNMARKQHLTRSFLLKLEPGKDYKFELKTGQKFKIHIDSIEDETIRGYMYQKNVEGKGRRIAYSSTFDNIEMYVAKIYVRKSDPIKTIILISLPVVLAAYWDSLQFIFFGG